MLDTGYAAMQRPYEQHTPPELLTDCQVRQCTNDAGAKPGIGGLLHVESRAPPFEVEGPAAADEARRSCIAFSRKLLLSASDFSLRAARPSC